MRRIDDASPMAVGGSGFGAADELGIEQAGESDAAQAVSGPAEESAAVDA